MQATAVGMIMELEREGEKKTADVAVGWTMALGTKAEKNAAEEVAVVVVALALASGMTVASVTEAETKLMELVVVAACKMTTESETEAETTVLEEVRLALAAGMTLASDTEAEEEVAMTVELSWKAELIETLRATKPEFGFGWVVEVCLCSCFSPSAFSSPPVSSLSVVLSSSSSPGPVAVMTSQATEMSPPPQTPPEGEHWVLRNLPP